MRIAHVITRLIVGGAQENTVLTCEGLMRAHGEQVLLIAGPPLGPEGSLVDQARAGGIPLEIVPQLRREIHPGRDVGSYFAIKRLLQGYRPDVVHTHSGKAGLLGRQAAHSLGVPAIVHTVHGAPFHPYQGRGARALFCACERYAARRCHALVSVADALTGSLVQAGVAPREKFTTIYSGMEVDAFLAADGHRQRMRQALGYSDQNVVVGKIARLFPLKGHEYLIAAAKQVVAQNPLVRFLLVGGGVLAGRLRDAVSRAGLDSFFNFTGLVPVEEIPAFLGAIDILVHASLREGLARVLPQALIAGKPVVSYDVDGAREVVVPDQTGFLLPPAATDEMAAAIVRLAGDAALRERLGAEGRRRCRDVFRHEHMTRQIHDLYGRVLAQPASRT